MDKLGREIAYQLRFGLPIWAVSMLLSWLPDSGPSVRLRGTLIAIFLPGRPKKLALGRDVTLLSIDRLKIGCQVYLAKGCWLNAIGGLTIEDEVVMAPYVVISTNNHGFKNGSVQQGGAHPAPVLVGKGSWLAAHSVVAAGVTLGSGSLLAANSVATKSFPQNCLLAGVPAVIVKERKDNPSQIRSRHDVIV